MCVEIEAGRGHERDRDLIVPLILTRYAPHDLFPWTNFDVDREATDDELLEAALTGSRRAEVRPGQRGVVEIGVGGTGCVLLSSEVFRAQRGISRK
jgi:hypothetical protein